MAAASKIVRVNEELTNRLPEVLRAIGWPESVGDKKRHIDPVSGSEKLRFSKPDIGRGGVEGVEAWGDFVGLVAYAKGLSQGDAANWLAEQFQIDIGGRGKGASRSSYSTSSKAKPRHSPPAAKELAEDGFSVHTETLEPFDSPKLDCLASLASAKDGVSVLGLERVGAIPARWNRKNDHKRIVIGIPNYTGPELKLCNYTIFSFQSKGLPIRVKIDGGKDDDWTTEWVPKLQAFSGSDRCGISTTANGLEMLRAGRPVEGLRVIWCEGLSDLPALAGIIPEGELAKVIPWTNSDGAHSQNAIKYLGEIIEKLKPSELVFIGDQDKAGQEAAAKWARLFSQTGIPIKCPKLPYDYEETHGKDLRDFIVDKHTWAELLELIDAAEVVRPGEGESVSPPVASETEQDDGPGPLANFETIIEIVDGEKKSHDEPIPILDIVSDVLNRCDQFPKRCGGSLFAIDGSNEVRALSKTVDLFAWLRETAEIDWKQGGKFTTKDELYSSLLHNVERFSSISAFPHFPPIGDVFYTCPEVRPGEGKALETFLDFFSPATSIDRQLLLAAIATTFWGGSRGERPAFQFASTIGQGGGKTTAATLIASLSGGTIEFDHATDRDSLTKRLLNGDSSPRVILFDNVKSRKFSSGTIESLITSKDISGALLYRGNGAIPNYWTVFITFNDPHFSRDLAQRTVSIKLGEPSRAIDWASRVQSFAKENQDEILEGVAAFFQRPCKPIGKLSRWAAWQGDILSRLDHPEEIAAELRRRETESDDDAQTADAISDYCDALLEDLNYVCPVKVHIPLSRIGGIVGDALGQSMSPRDAASVLDRLASYGLLDRIKRNPSRRWSRGFLVWSIEGKDELPEPDFEDRFIDRETKNENAKIRRIEKVRKSVRLGIEESENRGGFE